MEWKKSNIFRKCGFLSCVYATQLNKYGVWFIESDLMGSLTAARIVLLQEFIQGYPAAAHTHHDSAAEDADQAQFLGVSKLDGWVK